MNKYQKLASNTIILAIGQFGSKLLVYFMLKYYTSMLGADGFGDVNNIINASSLLISVVTLSINEGVLRFALDRSNNGKHVLSIGLNTAIIGLLLFAAAVPLIGFIDMLAEYRWLIYMYVATGSIKGICAIYVRARGHVKLFAADGIITTITVILLNLLFLGVFNLGVVGYVLSVSLGDFCSIIFLSLTAKLYKQYRPLGNDQVLAKSMIRYSIPLMPTTIMWWIINVSDTFMVTAFFGSAANGVYSFAFKFPNLAAIVVGIFSQAWHMSAITERNSRKISQFYSNVFSMIETVMFIAASGILLILRPLIMPFFGSEEFGYNKIVVERPQRDENGEIVMKRGKPVADAALRDTENVPLVQDIDAYFAREVLPYAPDAWIDKSKTKVGYEIPMTRYFYEYQPPEPVDDIVERIQTLEREIADSLNAMFHKEG